MPKAKANIDQLIAEYESGLTIRQVAERHGLTFQAVAQRLARHGVQLRPAHSRKYGLATCPTCSEAFYPAYSSQKYCSQVCVPRLGVHLQTHCRNGHPLIDENLYPRQGRKPPYCKICAQARYRAWRQRKKRV